MAGRPGARHPGGFAGSWQAPAVAAIACLLLAGTWNLWFPSPAPLPLASAADAATRQSLAEGRPSTSTSTSSTPPSALPQADPTGMPGRPLLILSALDVTAALEPAAVVDDQLVLPEDPARVGYWTEGAGPKDASGTVLLSGHVKWEGRQGALWALASSAPGDPVVLHWADGSTSEWVVSATTSRPRTADTTDLFTRQGPHRLVLVTCGGPLEQGHYRDLVTVLALPA